MPIVARLFTGLALGVTVLGAFGMVLVTFGADGRAFVREPRMPWHRDTIAAVPAAAPEAASPGDAAAPSQGSPAPAIASSPGGAGEPSAVDGETSAGHADEPPASASNNDAASRAPAGYAAGAAGDQRLARLETAPPAPVAEPTPAMSPAPAAQATPATTPPATSAANQSDARVAVLFATDRAPEGGDAPRFGASRARQVQLGRALVDARSAGSTPGGAATAGWTRFLQVAGNTAGNKGDTGARIELADGKRWAEMAAVAAASTPAQHRGRALVFVHGYNTTLEAALTRAAAIARDIRFDGLVLVYSWPSLGGIPSYSYDLASARQSEALLREFLAGPALGEALSGSGVTSVSILGEGMGAGLVLGALAELGTEGRARLKLDQVMLAAPDLDATRLQQLVARIDGGVRGLTLYAAAETRALAVSRRFHGGLPRAGDIAAGEPVVLAGIDSIDVTAAGGELLATVGSGAKPGAMARDIAALLGPDARSPDERTALRRVAARGGGHYWRLTP